MGEARVYDRLGSTLVYTAVALKVDILHFLIEPLVRSRHALDDQESKKQGMLSQSVS